MRNVLDKSESTSIDYDVSVNTTTEVKGEMHSNLNCSAKHRTIVISDLHLGSKWSKAKEVIDFLRHNSCQTLIMCGDIIDGWAIMRGSKKKWKRRHTNFLKTVLDLAQRNTKIVYIRGNHDDFLDRVIPLSFMNISLAKDYIHSSLDGRKYYVFHGDIFDKVTSSMGWLAKLGDVAYSVLLWANRIYNKYRIKRGLGYYSFAQEIKKRVKRSVSYISDFEEKVQELAISKGCTGVICGHIHNPEISMFGSIRYMNSGDWVESMSALIEDFDGNWNIYRYCDDHDVVMSCEPQDQECSDTEDCNSCSIRCGACTEVSGDYVAPI